MTVHRRLATTIAKHDRRMQTDPSLFLSGVEFGERARQNGNDALMTADEACVIRFTYVCGSAALLFSFLQVGKGRGERRGCE